MDSSLGTRRSAGTSTIVLLALTAVLASGLAYQALDAGRSHEAVARASLREQATFAAANFTSEARDEVLADLLEDGIEVTEDASDRDPGPTLSTERFRRESRYERWPAADHTRLFFRLDPASGEFRWGGDPDEETMAWVRATVGASLDDHAGDPRGIHLAFRPDDSDELLTWELSNGGRSRPAVHGLVLEVAALRRALDQAFDEDPLLPKALTSGRSNRDVFVARVYGPDDRVLYLSSDDPASDVVVRESLTGPLAALDVELAVREEAVEALVAGGVPESRMPSILALLGLTALLLGTAVWQLRREAELARLRADFVSGVSHQLLTPLTQIRMFGETLLLDRVRSDEERSRAAEIIVDEATRLTHQVENVLTFSRGEADALHLSPIETDVSALLHDVVEGFEPLANAEGATLETSIEPGVHSFVDPEAIRQATLNLLDNALKYGPEGQAIHVGVDADGQDQRAVIWIEDEGPGVREADRARIWDAYVRLDRDRERTSGGSGIGLAVVRRAIETQGGTVRVADSRRNGGHGARFVVELPAQPSTA